MEWVSFLGNKMIIFRPLRKVDNKESAKIDKNEYSTILFICEINSLALSFFILIGNKM